MKKIFAGILTLFLCLTIVGCGKKENVSSLSTDNSNNNSSGSVEANSNPIVGTWEYEEDGGKIVYTFRQNNTGSSITYMGNSVLENDSFTYSINGNRITIVFNSTNEQVKSDYRINGNTLVIEDLDENMIFKRK